MKKSPVYSTKCNCKENCNCDSGITKSEFNKSEFTKPVKKLVYRYINGVKTVCKDSPLNLPPIPFNAEYFTDATYIMPDESSDTLPELNYEQTNERIINYSDSE